MLQTVPGLKKLHEVYPLHGDATWQGADPDLYIALVGEERSVGRFRCEQFPLLLAVHTVWEGRGTVLIDRCPAPMEAGDVFVFFPGHHIVHFDSPDAPWSYTWFVLKGTRAVWALERCGLTNEAPRRPQAITPRLRALMQELLNAYRDRTVSPVAAIAYAWAFVAALQPPVAQYHAAAQLLPVAEAARTLLEAEYVTMPSIAEVARRLNVDRSTLFRKFRERFGIAPKAFLEAVRLRKADWLLRTRRLSVKAIAAACGYNDVNYFCRIFRKHYGAAPQHWRARFQPRSR